MFGFAAKAFVMFFIAILVLPSEFTASTLKAVGAPLQHSPAKSVALSDLSRVVSGAREDFSGFCLRQPEVCESGERIAAGVKERAAFLANVALTWIAEGDTADGYETFGSEADEDDLAALTGGG